jgi:hypothetical protein
MIPEKVVDQILALRAAWRVSGVISWKREAKF